jgi:transposase
VDALWSLTLYAAGYRRGRYHPIGVVDLIDAEILGRGTAILRRRFAPFGVGLAGSEVMTTLADDLVPDELWALVAPLLPAPPRPPYGGRHLTISDRAWPAAIVYMARTSTPWRLLPAREPLSVVVTAANTGDTTMFQAVVEDIPPIRTPAGRRRTRPAAVHADKGYDSRANRAYLRRRGISARIARRQIESSARLGRHRWKVERSLSWLSCFRRLQVRWDRDAGRWFAFLLLACAVVCFNRL